MITQQERAFKPKLDPTGVSFADLKGLLKESACSCIWQRFRYNWGMVCNLWESPCSSLRTVAVGAATGRAVGNPGEECDSASKDRATKWTT